jgi:hypothetical protein
MFKLPRMALVIGVVLACAFPLGAQTKSSKFKYQVTPYFWMSGIDGDVGALGETTHIDESFGDIWDNLKFGAMGTFEGRWDRWVFLGDALYINQQADRSTPDDSAFDNARVKSKMLILDPEFGYQIVRRDGVELNALVGGRYWHLKNELQLTGPGVSPAGFTETADWIDPIIGLQVRKDIGHAVYVTGKADIGGFSVAARLDWQAFGGVGYRVSDRVSVLGGYRVLSVDYSKNGFLFDTTLQGVVVGIGIGF